MSEKKKVLKSPYFKILLSFIIIIIIGTFLLWLPISTSNGQISFIDAMFTSFSAVSGSGMLTIPDINSSFSIFGKIILAILMEIGGISFLTLALFIFIIIGAKLGIEERFMMKEALNVDTPKGIFKLTKFIIIISFAVQIFGAVINMIIFLPYYQYDFLKALGVSIFHAVSSFTNAGLDLFGSESMIPLKDNILLNINTIFLMLIGSLGIVIFFDIFTKRKWKGLSLHTKIVLVMTLILIVFAVLFIKISMPELSIMQCIFYSTSVRSTGLSVFDMKSINNSTYILTILLMFIGGAPSSTAGGIKVTTLFVIIIALFYYSKGKKPKAFYRAISKKSIYRAFYVVLLSLLYLIIAIFILSFSEKNIAIQNIVFDSIAAFSTTGFSMGTTSSLSICGKLVFCVTMFLGRLGPITIANLWNKNWIEERSQEIRYIEENVIIG